MIIDIEGWDYTYSSMKCECVQFVDNVLFVDGKRQEMDKIKTFTVEARP